MKPTQLTVLYVCTDWLEVAGSTASLVNMIRSVGEAVHPIVLVCQDGPVQQHFTDLGIETIVHDFFFLWNKPKSLKTSLHHPTRTLWWHAHTDDRRCANYVVSVIGERKVDIVHSNTSAVTVGATIARRLKAKHIWHVREDLVQMGKRIYGGAGKLYRKIAEADAVVLISHALADRLSIPTDHQYVVWNAIRSEKDITFDPIKDRYVLFCAAGLYEFKGPDMAIRAFSKSGLAQEDYVLKLIGNCDPDYRIELEKVIADCGSKGKVEFLGQQSDVRPFFEKATAFLMCSKFEGLGRVSLESMFFGCPVVARNAGGTTDFVRHGETGFLFDTEDQCAELLQRVAHSDQTEIVRKAQAMVRQHFVEEGYGQKILDIYHKII